MRRSPFFCLLLVCAAALPSAAQWEPEQTHVFSDIVIPAGHKVQSATCFFCSIRVEGELNDGASTQWGDITVSGRVGGDTVAVGGDVRLGPGAQVQGDSVSVFGDTVLQAGAYIGGDAVASLGAVQLSPGATVQKTTVPVPWFAVEWLPSRVRASAVFWLLGMAVSLPLAFACLAWPGKSRLLRVTDAMKVRRWRTVFFGIVILGLITAALEIGGETDYADWLELPLLLLATVMAAPGYTALSVRIGERLRTGTKTSVVLGTLLLVTLQVVPIVGWLLALVLMILCVGSLPASFRFRLPDSSQPLARQLTTEH
jgi:hypothetical protein